MNIRRPGSAAPVARRRCPAAAKQRGFTLLEILVTLVIVSFGLLGAAGLQMRMLSEDQEAFQRAQALLLVDDLLSRISANRHDAAAYVTAAPLGSGDAADCTAPATLAQRDLCAWRSTLRGRGERYGADQVGAMLGARGCVEQIDFAPLTLRVTVAWQGMTQLAAPTLPCGQDLYGSDGYRRAVSSRIAFGALE